MYDKVQVQSNLSLKPNLYCTKNDKCHATCDWESASIIKSSWKGDYKVVKNRKLEDIVKDLPIELTTLAKDETKNLPKISLNSNNCG